jgi:2-phosphosulfolactate phosphatase
MIDSINSRMPRGQSDCCCLDWGENGALRAAKRADLVVIVDTLSFSTAVVTAVHYGGLVHPCPPEKDAAELARPMSAEVAVPRNEVPQKGRFSLSPLTYLGLEAGTRVVLPSLNGGRCSYHARGAAMVITGAFVNAKAVGSAVSQALDTTDLGVTIVACGEIQKLSTGQAHVRFAVEDYLAAGAIISYLQCEKSPDARVCEGAFLHNREYITGILRDCESGRELYEQGYGKDVEFAAQLDVYDSVPIMRGDFFERFR